MCIRDRYHIQAADSRKEKGQRQEYHDLVDAFRYFEPVDPALVAPDSLLREFIGGGRYHY